MMMIVIIMTIIIVSFLFSYGSYSFCLMYTVTITVTTKRSLHVLCRLRQSQQQLKRIQLLYSLFIFTVTLFDTRAGKAQQLQPLATGLTVRLSNPVGGEIFCTCSNALRLSQSSVKLVPDLPQLKWRGRSVDYTSLNQSQPEERLELLFYSRFGNLW